MLIVCDSKRPQDNRSWLNIFQSTVNLSPHSRIALTSATIPLEFSINPPGINITTGVNDTISIRVTDNNSNTVVNTLTLPAGVLSITGLISVLNSLSYGFDFKQGSVPPPLPYPNDFMIHGSWGFDPCCGQVYLSIGTSQLDDALLPIAPPTITILYTTLAYELGFFTNIAAGSMTQGLTGFDGYIKGMAPPQFLTEYYQSLINQVVPLYISLPAFQIYTPISGSSNLTNTKSVVHTIYFQPRDYVSFTDFLSALYQGGVAGSGTPIDFRIRLVYEPPLHQYVEINNDAVTPVNDMRVDILNDSGNLNTSVDIVDYTQLSPSSLSAINSRVIITFEIETEPEKTQEALRQVKDKLRFERFLKNHQYQSPL